MMVMHTGGAKHPRYVPLYKTKGKGPDIQCFGQACRADLKLASSLRRPD